MKNAYERSSSLLYGRQTGTELRLTNIDYALFYGSCSITIPLKLPAASPLYPCPAAGFVAC